MDRLLINVGRENLNRRRLLQPVRLFAEKNRDRIGFLARRAAGTQTRSLIRIGSFPAKSCGMLCCKRGERCWVAKKMGNADQQILQERAAVRHG